MSEEAADTSSVHTSIEEAVAQARQYLKAHGQGLIIIHRPDGSIEEEYSLDGLL